MVYLLPPAAEGVPHGGSVSRDGRGCRDRTRFPILAIMETEMISRKEVFINSLSFTRYNVLPGN